MLIQFSVENFLSIKDKVVFSMVASTDKENSENLINGNKENYLKSAVIYGANASGKSNILKALNALVFMMRNSNSMQPKMLLPIFPFKFDKEYISKPSSFEVTMLLKDNIKYVYGLIADENKIYEEYLYYYPNGKQTKIFERTETNKYDYTAAESSLGEITPRNMENKFLLATATTWNYEKTKPAYDFITDGMTVLFGYEPLKNVAFEQYYNDKTGKLKEFSLNVYDETDINIKGYNIASVEMTEDQLSMIPPELRTFFPKGSKGYSVGIAHNVIDGNGESKEIILDFEEESLGTQNMFILNPFLLYVLTEGKVLIIDELDKSLHPFLVKYIVNLFNSKEHNKNGAQLIFNTHDTNLLSLNLFRRDQIWFTEKDDKKGATDLYPLDDFPVRKTENVQKGYLNGRYGAIPFIAMGDNLWVGK